MYKLHVIVSICSLWTKQQVCLLVAVPQDLWAPHLPDSVCFVVCFQKRERTHFMWRCEGERWEKKKKTQQSPQFLPPQGLFWTFCWERLGPPHWESGRARAELLPTWVCSRDTVISGVRDAQSPAPALHEGHPDLRYWDTSSASSFVGSPCGGYSLWGASRCCLAHSACYLCQALKSLLRSWLLY